MNTILRISGIATFILSGTLLGCLKPEVNSLDFFNITTKEAASVSIDSFLARGTISNAGLSTLDSVGFVWSTDIAELSTSDNLPSVTLDMSPQGNGDFTALLPTKREGTIYYRAFGQLDKRRVVSQEIHSFELGQIVTMQTPTVVFNNTATIQGRTSGLEIYGFEVDDHGHVYSASVIVPEIGLPDCDTTSLGEINDDAIFISLAKGLEFNTKYYVRSYLIVDGKPIYSKQVDSFQVKDGWRPFNSLPVGLHSGVCVSVPDLQLVFAGFGCESESECPVDALKDRFWKFDQSNGWVENSLPQVPPTIDRRVGVSAANYKDNIFFISGEEQNNGIFLNSRFDSYNIQNQSWTILPDMPLPLRSRAIAFVIQDKLYAGTGLSVDAQFNASWLSDFWEYNITDSTWRQVSSIPIAREHAVVFAFDDYAIVGGGVRGAEFLNDFYKFTPPSLSNPNGSWEAIADFPGRARDFAVGFAIGDKGYYGTGVDSEEFILDDWWEYNPANNEWISRTPYLGGRKAQAMGYEFNGKGYLGCGLKRVVEPNGNNVTNVLTNDFWEYIPEQD